MMKGKKTIYISSCWSYNERKPNMEGEKENGN